MALDQVGQAIMSAMGGNVLSSQWAGLNRHLLAQFFEVRGSTVNGVRKWERAQGGVTVQAPLSDSSLAIDLSWNDPFGDSGMQNKSPALMAMLQSGQMQGLLDTVTGMIDKGKAGAATAKMNQAARDFANKAEGRASITKLNSTQIFSGMPPIKFTVKALFRAWNDPAAEVEAPINQLMAWALPQELSEDGTLVQRLANSPGSGSDTLLNLALPSLAPTVIGMTYKGRTFLPLVIENISLPLSSPINGRGQYTHMQVDMTIQSLTAIDANDWKEANKGGLF